MRPPVSPQRHSHTPHHDHHHTHEDRAAPADYRTWVKPQRLSKDQYFKRSDRSPIPAEERSSFGGLHYYALNPA